MERRRGIRNRHPNIGFYNGGPGEPFNTQLALKIIF